MKKLVLLGVVVLVAACFYRTPNSMFYGLRAIAPQNTYSKPNISVAINRAVIPSYLDKPQIVMRAPDGVEWQISEYNRWGETLNSLLQRVLADDLSLALPNSIVKPQTFSAESYDYYVSIEINRMDGTWGKEAVLDSWWTITDDANQVLKRKKTNLSTPLGKTYEDYAQIQSQQLSQLAEQIASELSRLK